MTDKKNEIKNQNSRFNDNDTFAPRVVTKGDGKNPLDAQIEEAVAESKKD